jgi:thiol-disulfide isomerase/thioredoxin
LLEANEGDGEKAREDYNKKTFNLMLTLADSIISNTEIRSYVYFNAFNNVLKRNDMQLIESVKRNFASRFQEVVADTTMNNYIANKIRRLERLMPRMPAPAFSFPDITGTQISLADFKGKYVYIDVWATWCVPCIREIPKLKELEQEFGDEIAFLSISIDYDKERWHKYVKEKALTGVQILSLPQIGIISSSCEIMELYMIQGIPRYIMIDPDGTLIDADASRPSDEKTRKIFEEWTSRNADDV